MSDDVMATEALRSAHAASNLATRALAISENVFHHLNTISTSIEVLRAENTQQHADNARMSAANTEKIHERISSIKVILEKKIDGAQEKERGRWDKYKDKLLGILLLTAFGILLYKLGVRVEVPTL